MGKREERRKRTRQKIIEVSRILFSEKGFDQTKTSMIAKEAKIAEGTIFNYFNTKSEILLAVISEFLEMEAMDLESLKTLPLDEVLDCFFNYYFKNLALVDKGLLKVIFSNAFSNRGEVYETMIQIDEEIFGSILNFLLEKDMIKEEDAETVKHLIFSTALVAFSEYMMKDAWTVDELKEKLKDSILYILRV